MISSIALSLLTLLAGNAGSFWIKEIFYLRGGEKYSDGNLYDLNLQIPLGDGFAKLGITELDLRNYTHFVKDDEGEIEWDKNALENIAKEILQIDNEGEYTISFKETTPKVLPLNKSSNNAC